MWVFRTIGGIMKNAIKEIIKKANSENIEELLCHAERHLKAKSNLFFAEIFARKMLKISKNCGDALDLLDRLGNLYYGKKKATIDNHDFRCGDIDMQGLKGRIEAIKDHGEIYSILKPVIDRDAETIVETINKGMLSHADSAVAVAKALGEKYVDPEYMDKLRSLNARIEKGGAPDYIRAINKNILRNALNSSNVEILKNNFAISRHNFVVRFLKHRACSYCNSSLMDLLKFYAIQSSKRGRGLSWEIDRKDPAKSYEENNYEFVCYYCNNAKSDVFTEKEFRKNIGPAIGRTISNALS